MRLNTENTLVVLIIALFTSTWYYYQIDLGSRTLASLPELIVYVILLVLIGFLGRKPRIPKRWRTVIYVFFGFGLFHFLLSLSSGLPLGSTLGGFRRLVYYPVVGIIAGYTFSSLPHAHRTLRKAFKYFFLLILALAVANALFRFRELQDYALIYRPDAMIISVILLAYFQQFISNRKINRQSALVIITCLLLVFFSASRGVFLAVAGGLGLMTLFRWRSVLSHSLVKILVGVTVASGIFYGIYLQDFFQQQIDRHIGQITDFYQGDYGTYGENMNNVALRYYRYMDVFNTGLQKPIQGNGLGYKMEAIYIGGNFERYEVNKTPHNYLLTIWYKLGAPGIVIFIAFLGTIYRDLGHYRPVQVFFLICFLYSLVDTMMASTPSAILAVFFVAGAMAVKPKQPETPRLQPDPIPHDEI